MYPMDMKRDELDNKEQSDEILINGFVLDIQCKHQGVRLINALFANNIASKTGGAIASVKHYNSIFTIRNTSFINNIADGTKGT